MSGKFYPVQVTFSVVVTYYIYYYLSVLRVRNMCLTEKFFPNQKLSGVATIFDYYQKTIVTALIKVLMTHIVIQLSIMVPARLPSPSLSSS